uniref:Secreted protein n=1 Tax=Oryza meridionalis TaxID=40149 RepID=A0A0E0FBK1_9ORYZ
MHRKILRGNNPISFPVPAFVFALSLLVLKRSVGYEPIVGLEFCNPLYVSQSGPKMHRFSLYWRTCCAKV